jgi:hypothetical protein
MKKYLCLLSMAVIVMAAGYYNVMLVKSFLALPETTLLWCDGVVAGWFQMIVFLLVFDAMIFFPLWMMWDLYNDLRKEK